MHADPFCQLLILDKATQREQQRVTSR